MAAPLRWYPRALHFVASYFCAKVFSGSLHLYVAGENIILACFSPRCETGMFRHDRRGLKESFNGMENSFPETRDFECHRSHGLAISHGVVRSREAISSS
jgi:hypothetical protein